MKQTNKEAYRAETNLIFRIIEVEANKFGCAEALSVFKK